MATIFREKTAANTAKPPAAIPTWENTAAVQEARRRTQHARSAGQRRLQEIREAESALVAADQVAQEAEIAEIEGTMTEAALATARQARSAADTSLREAQRCYDVRAIKEAIQRAEVAQAQVEANAMAAIRPEVEAIRRALVEEMARQLKSVEALNRQLYALQQAHGGWLHFSPGFIPDLLAHTDVMHDWYHRKFAAWLREGRAAGYDV